jgi:hypothetical protein
MKSEVMTTIASQTGAGLPLYAEGSIVSSPKRLARIAGLLYLAVGILGAFAFAAVYAGPGRASVETPSGASPIAPRSRS